MVILTVAGAFKIVKPEMARLDDEPVKGSAFNARWRREIGKQGELPRRL